ncbi:hypothetical protein [Paenibacillus sp. NAIST15-1]|uniref:hypothetical protein n=1 Tax=Paenibacillus sp. NAIST15-1 TaxID=1605994 RepID=UPI000868E833|nr:hypothetical protein [Paenibacillus sp. NAIST15-1]GAV12824.1 putative lipoprotein [Paenibacillus sp. NAIST15-1]
MKKWILAFMCMVILMLLTGCEGWFNAIPKDKVMVKQIRKENPGNEPEYEGVLSQETAKTLSLKAINTYYEMNVTMDELRFESMYVDQNKLNDLLNSPRPQEEPVVYYGDKTLPDRIPEGQSSLLDQIPRGLYYVTLTQSVKPNEIYDVVLNAKDGDIVKISRSGGKQNRVQEIARDKVFDIANRFIQEEGSYPLTELTLNQDMTRWDRDGEAEVFYTSKDNQTLKYSVTVSFYMNGVSGFSKDIMALLNYIRVK